MTEPVEFDSVSPPDEPFRQAFVRLKMEQQLYVERTNAITFITPSLFRASVPLPANVSARVRQSFNRLEVIFEPRAAVVHHTAELWKDLLQSHFADFLDHAAPDLARRRP